MTLDPVPVHRDENFGPCSSAQGRKILDPVPVHRDEKFWTQFQCTGTKIFGPCSSAQGRKILDPVPVHRDEKFWTQFQCTGTKILDPVPVHRDEKFSDTSMMSIYHPSSDGNATLSLGFIGRHSSE
jgi:hypothetical protein